MIANTLPQFVYNGTTLWLPRGFTSWDAKLIDGNKITKGPVYTQIVAYPNLYEITATTDVFQNTQDVWNGTSGYFLDAFMTFYTTWASLGNVFSFYRNGNDSTAGRSYFQYCVWIGADYGLKRLIGNERYTIDIKLQTEGAAR